jgi:all-trans-retinol dehydrogenase (NAD+)
MELAGRRAIVTGGARGIGLCTARRLLAEGCAVAIWDRDKAALAAAQAELSGRGQYVAVSCDVTDPEQVAAAVRETEERLGGVEILINNAGTTAGGRFVDHSSEEWETLVRVNLNALLYTTHAVLPRMEAAGFGRVVNLSSAGGMVGVAQLSVYAATKWAVWGFTESLRQEYWDGRSGDIRFSSIHPNYVRTGLFEGARMRGIGGLIAPQLRSHDVVAKAIVESALKRGRGVVRRPRALRLGPLLRGLLPDALFQRALRALDVHRSMGRWTGSGDGRSR